MPTKNLPLAYAELQKAQLLPDTQPYDGTGLEPLNSCNHNVFTHIVWRLRALPGRWPGDLVPENPRPWERNRMNPRRLAASLYSVLLYDKEEHEITVITRVNPHGSLRKLAGEGIMTFDSYKDGIEKELAMVVDDAGTTVASLVGASDAIHYKSKGPGPSLAVTEALQFINGRRGKVWGTDALEGPLEIKERTVVYLLKGSAMYANRAGLEDAGAIHMSLIGELLLVVGEAWRLIKRHLPQQPQWHWMAVCDRSMDEPLSLGGLDSLHVRQLADGLAPDGLPHV